MDRRISQLNIDFSFMNQALENFKRAYTKLISKRKSESQLLTHQANGTLPKSLQVYNKLQISEEIDCSDLILRQKMATESYTKEMLAIYIVCSRKEVILCLSKLEKIQSDCQRKCDSILQKLAEPITNPTIIEGIRQLIYKRLSQFTDDCELIKLNSLCEKAVKETLKEAQQTTTNLANDLILEDHDQQRICDLIDQKLKPLKIQLAKNGNGEKKTATLQTKRSKSKQRTKNAAEKVLSKERKDVNTGNAKKKVNDKNSRKPQKVQQKPKQGSK